jgi:adenosylcobinamide kinase/adenosylcobinamide-phosphate guanylyltransferase
MYTLVLGGARSGKSRYAQSLCAGEAAVVYVATARDEDDEMHARIARHRADRPSHWGTVEESSDIARAVLEAPRDAVVLVDCVTVWLSNLFWEYRDLAPPALEQVVLERVGALAAATDGRRVVLVSNELGQGIVPATPVGRHFRDIQGLTNQYLAAHADRVVLMVAGLPLRLKGSDDGISR